MIPEKIQISIDEYVKFGRPTGGFVRAVLENDLFGAVGRADHENIVYLKAIVLYVYNEIPGNCWGSADIVRKHISKFVTDKIHG